MSLLYLGVFTTLFHQRYATSIKATWLLLKIGKETEYMLLMGGEDVRGLERDLKYVHKLQQLSMANTVRLIIQERIVTIKLHEIQSSLNEMTARSF